MTIERAGPAHLRRPAWTLALLLALPLVFLWRPILLGETFYRDDLGAQYFPRERLLARQGLSGWNPHEFLGMGLTADPQTAPFEPVRALARRCDLGERVGLILYLAVYLTIATLGTWVLARRFGAAPAAAALTVLAFVWGGVFLVRFRHPALFVSLALIPWAACAADRLVVRRAVGEALWLGGLEAWAALGGQPQGAYMTWLFVLAWVAVRTWHDDARAGRGARWRSVGAQLLRLGAGAALCCGLLAGAYGPVLAGWLGSARGGDSSLKFAGAFSFNPWDWPRLLAPDLYGNDLAGTYFGGYNFHEQTCYLGVAPLALFVLALGWRPRRVWPLPALALGFLALSAGKYLPPFYLAYAVVPGFRMFRCACRFSWFFALVASVVAGLTLTRIAAGERPGDPARARRWSGRLSGGLALACALAAGAFALWSGVDRLTKPGAHLAAAGAAARAAVLLLAVRAVLGAWLRGRLGAVATTRALLALTCLDLAAQWLPYRQSSPPREVFPAPAVVAALAAASPGRVLVHAVDARGEPESVPLLNWGEAAGYDDLRGYNQLAPSDTLELLARADVGRRARAVSDGLGGSEPADWLLDLAGVTRIAARAGAWPARWRDLPLAAEGGGWQVRRRAGALPRAWLVGAAERVPGAEVLARLPWIDPRRVVLLAGPDDVALPRRDDGTPAGAARLVRRSPDDVDVEVEAARPALAVLADRFDPHWSATVDGAPSPLLRADALLRAVAVPPGRHLVHLLYRAPGALGWRITAATLAALALVSVGGWFSQRSRALRAGATLPARPDLILKV